MSSRCLSGLVRGRAFRRRDGSAAGWSGGDALPHDELFPPLLRRHPDR